MCDSLSCRSVGGDSSEEEECERIKLQLGVGEGWALKGVSCSCISNEWCQEYDVVANPRAQNAPSTSSTPPPPPGAVSEPAHELKDMPSHRSADDENEKAGAEIVSKPCPSVSWASWLLSFLLNHPPVRRLAMRASLFRTLVAYLRSAGAPHRLRMVPLLTLLVRSHTEFEESPPPLEELSGLVAAVLRECDKATCGRGPGSYVWRPRNCPRGLQLLTRWASAGLLLLTDLAMATRRAQDSLRQQPCQSLVQSGAEGQRRTNSLQVVCANGDLAESGGQASGSETRRAVEGVVRLCVPPFGTRLDENPIEEGGEEEAEDAERSLADRMLVHGRSLGAEDRALLEVDLRNSVLPDVGDFALLGEAASMPDATQNAGAGTKSSSRCLHTLLEIMDTLHALRDGWPSAPSATTSESLPCDGAMAWAPKGPLYLDSLLCEAWMDAVGPASVIESEHPFRKGTCAETLRFPGAEELVIFLDPRSSMQQVRSQVPTVAHEHCRRCHDRVNFC